MKTTNLNIHSPIGFTGYGYAGLNIVKELVKIPDLNTSLFPIGQIAIQSELDAEAIKTTLQNQDNFAYDAPTVKIWHQFDLASKPGNGKYFAYPFFELTLFNNKEKHNLNFPDELIVSSSWAKQIILDNGINKPTHIVPLGVDRSIFDPSLYKSQNIDNKYVFITIGKWEKRKSHDLIIKLFSKAFGQNDSVELWMITHNPFLNEEQEKEWHNLVFQSPLKAKIKIFPRIKTQMELANIINFAHCGLFFSRAEGWNLDMLEVMSMGKPVITTDYSAHTEFCNKDNAMLVKIDDLEDADDGKWFHGFGQWAKISQTQEDQIIEFMQNCYKNRLISNPHGVETANKFSWKHSAEKLLRCIKE